MDALRHSLRRLLRAPSLTATALVTLAIAIGPNTAVFSIVRGVLIKPLPYPDAERLVGIWHAAPGLSLPGDLNCSPSMYFTYGEENRSFEHFGLLSQGGATVTGVAEPELVLSALVTYGALQALGVPPALGRLFSREDDTPGSAETVILSGGYWRRRFGGDPSLIGRTLTVDLTPRVIVGVMPDDFRLVGAAPDLILPHRFDRNTVFIGNFSYQGIARLKPDVTMAEANADVGRMLPMWLQGWPVPPGFDRKLFESARLAPSLHPLKRDVVGNIGDVLWVLLGTIAIVLLIACANVANLLLVRAEGRQQELAIRAALGASWGRIARELLVDALALALVGGVLGVLLAQGSLAVLRAIGPATLPRLSEIRIDWVVLLYAAGVSILSGLLFGAVPILKYAGPRLAGALGAQGRTVSHSRERHRARRVLVVAQVALALVLLIGAGLMIRSFQALRAVQPGFTRPETIQTARVVVTNTDIPDPERVLRSQQAILDKVAGIPGVTSAAFVSAVPMEGFNSNDVLFAEDKIYEQDKVPPIRRFKFVSPGVFATMGTSIVAGRDMTWTDLYERRAVAIVSENMARELWGTPAAALGKRLRQAPTTPWREVVGVVADVYDNGVHEAAPATVYWPALTEGLYEPLRVQRSVAFVIRTARAGTEPFLKELRAAVWSVNPNLPLALVRTVDEVYRTSMARTSFTVVMLAVAGGMALVLGVIGIYGVVSYTVSQRTKEIGIRMALGAEQGELRQMFLRYGFGLAIAGAVIGSLGAVALTRVMSSLLFGVNSLDPLTYAVVAAALVVTAALASAIPAWRAAAVDPVEALRVE
jgi:predicted permease